MAVGLYIHVPFCRQKCAYCDFYSVAAEPEAIEHYLELLLFEAQLRTAGQTIDTVFFGGGTPSILSDRQISTVLEGVSRYFCLAQDVEITLEANPETLTQQALSAYRQAGINRLSVGVQTLTPALLPVLGRRHTAQEALSAIDCAQAAGFTNMSCDLIYGIPGQTLANWQDDLHALAARGLTHLSLYCLEIYGDTPLGRAIAKGEVLHPDEELAADMYDFARIYLPDQGLQQYEISNFALSGWECRHNINYWRNGDYIGLGPAACSYWQGKRECNVPNLAKYQQLLMQGQCPIGSSERLDEQGTAAETLILGLRLNAGVDKAAFAQRFGYTLEDAFADELSELLQKGWLVATKEGYALAWHVRPIANAVFRMFLGDSNT